MAPQELDNRVHTVLITLDGARPKVWRRVEVPSPTRLDELHILIQALMDWEDMHLHDFEFSGRHYRETSDPGVELPGIEESTVRIGDVLRRKGSSGAYTYDYGDTWRLVLTCEEVSDADPETIYPRLLGGHGTPPPEDCGGVLAFDDLRRLRDDPLELESDDSEEGSELRFWVDMLEPDELDLAAERRRLRKEFGTLPLEEDIGPQGPPLEPARPVALPPEEDLARAAVDTEVLGELLRFARRFDPPRKLTGTGMPRPADVRAMVEEEGLLQPFTEREAETRTARLDKLRAAADLPGFLNLWYRAVNLEAVEVVSSRAQAAPWVVDGPAPAQALQLWADLLDETIEEEPEEPGPFTGMIERSDLLPLVLRMLYEAPDDEEVGLYSAVEAVLETVDDEGEGEADELELLRLILRDTLYRGVLELSRTGALSLSDRTPAEITAQCWDGSLAVPVLTRTESYDDLEDPGIDCTVVLTPLGRYGLRQILLREGVHAPLVGNLAEAGADELLDALVLTAPENHSAEFTPWLELREPAAAVEEVVEAAARGPEASAFRRTMAQEVLLASGPQGIEALRACLGSEHAEVSGLAAAALLSSGSCSDEESERLIAEYGAWLAIDMATGPMELGQEHGSNGDEQLSILLDYLTGAGAEPGTVGAFLTDGVDGLWRCTHPTTLPVLQCLGRVHPDKKAAKAARRAAHKAQSRV